MRIIATGKCLPEKVLTNAELEKMVDTTDEWIMTRTGIKERRICSEEESSLVIGTKAAREALEKSGLRGEDIDLIIVATVTPVATFPSTACYIQGELGATRAAAFDLQAACSGFIYSLVVANQFLRYGRYHNVLIVGTEKLSSIVDWNDRATCVLFGDGAGAAILQSDASSEGLIGFDLGANGNLHEILYLTNNNSYGIGDNVTPPEKHVMRMEGQDVFKQAVTEMARSAVKVLNKAGLTIDDLKCVIPHQANMRIISALGNRLKVPEDKMFVNLHRYGNISAACVPVALDEAAVHYNFKRGDKILLIAFGGGLTWACALIEW